MDMIHGFELSREERIRELNTRVLRYRHRKTGAEVLSLINGDENKVFGITFRTPPSDSTGVAHILEHSVLCGSRKYPVKEPFVELLKGSLQTFLNAFTYPDKTCYPVASQNVQDFHNLIDVYLDAVFYPRLTPHVLEQEGWHLELERAEDPLIYKGVVYNEMKGAYSSPDSLLSEYSLQSLFPDNPYGLDSGGHPREIPKLTYERFLDFHRKYYHPSNARIFFYGDDDPDRRLRILDEYLGGFEPLVIDSAVPLQPRFPQPRHLIRPYRVGEEESVGGAKAMVSVNWVLAASAETEMNFALRILEYILLGMPGSPLRKALIESGLGEDLVGGGLGTELRQIYFSTGLKGVRIEEKEKVEPLVLSTLSHLAGEGIDPRTIEAAFNTLEFRFRENNTGHFPRGLLLMLRALTTWLYDEDPLLLLAFEGPLNHLKNSLKSEPFFFEEMIREKLLKNPHRTTLFLEPDPGLREREEAEERDHLLKVRDAMTADGEARVIQNTLELKRIQEAPDPPEALAAIPTLKIEDLDPRNKVIPLDLLSFRETKILFHDLPTNGIVYLDLGFNLHVLQENQLPYIPLLGRAFVEMGTEQEDFVSLSQRISRKTGGIWSDSMISASRENKRCEAWLFLRGKVMAGRAEELTQILLDVLLTLRLDDRDRFRRMALEEKARCEERLIPRGHQMVNLRLRSHFGEAHWAAEKMNGISYLIFLRELIRRIDEDWASELATLEEIRRILVNANGLMVNLTMEGEGLSRVEPHLHKLLESLPSLPVSAADWNPNLAPLHEGLTLPSQVNYVGKGANLYDLGYRFHGSSLVITRYLRTSWLWDRVRVQGGAYGAFCNFDRLSGVLTFVSYRDPNLLKTLEVFDQVPAFLRETNLGRDELNKSIIGAIGDLDTYLLPDAKGYTSMIRHLIGDTEEIRQKMREEILTTTEEDFKAFAPVLDEWKEIGVIKVLGSTGEIGAAASNRAGWLRILKVL
jgi:presequence protease